jgi:hypothetical protein
LAADWRSTIWYVAEPSEKPAPLIDTRQVVTVVVTAIASGLITKVFDGSWLVIAVVTGAALLVGVTWGTVSAFRRLLGRVKALEVGHGLQRLDVGRIDKVLVHLNTKQGEGLASVKAQISDELVEIRRRLQLVEAVGRARVASGRHQARAEGGLEA